MLDLEWDGNDPDKRLLVVGFDGKAYAGKEQMPKFALARPEPKMAFTREDHKLLEQRGYTVGGSIIDIQAMAWTYDERTPLSLDWLVKHYLGKDPDKRLVRKQGKVYFRCQDGSEVLIADAPLEELKDYNRRDLRFEKELAVELRRRLVEQGRWRHFVDEQIPFSRVLLDMELNGLPIDVEALEELAARLEGRIEFAEVILREAANIPDSFNLNSGTQIAKLLFTKGNFWLPDRYKLTKEEMEQARDGEWPERLPLTFVPTKLGRDYIYGDHDIEGFGLRAKVKAPKCKAGNCGHKLGEHVPSVATKVLSVHYGDNEWVSDLMDYRLNTKALQFLTAWQAVQRNGRLYARFNHTGTATGRLSSSDPNLQNIPARGALGKEIRGLFRAKPGHYIVQGDYGQIEPRLMGHFSGDPVMRDIFRNGQDIYVEMTEAVLGKRFDKGTPERKLVQITFLAQGYGAQPPKIRATLAEAGYRFDLGTVENVSKDLRDLFKVYWSWADDMAIIGQRDGYVETLSGHRRHLDFGGQAWKAERQAVNSIIQGSAADIVRRLMMAVHGDGMFTGWKMVAQVHDEILWEVPEDRVTKLHIDGLRFQATVGMEGRFKLIVPLEFEPKMVRTWAEAK